MFCEKCGSEIKDDNNKSLSGLHFSDGYFTYTENGVVKRITRYDSAPFTLWDSGNEDIEGITIIAGQNGDAAAPFGIGGGDAPSQIRFVNDIYRDYHHIVFIQ